MRATSLMPERIGRFHVQAMLGRGAMGVVYRGHDEEIDRLVAIKLIRADLLDTEDRENYLRRFRNEAKIAGRCVHANIVSLYDFAMHDGNPYLVMEYVNGVGLQQAISRGSQRPVSEVLPIALQVLDALKYAHERGIVHRDIKPANILLTRQSTVKITDFGISRLLSMELTALPLLIGTPSYMSPQQCCGVELDGRSDLFSLGCVLYEMLAGERPFTGVSYTDTIFNIVNTKHRPLSTLRDDLPNGLSEAIDHVLAKQADDRYENADAFARALCGIVEGSGQTPTAIIEMITQTRRTRARMARFAAPTNPDTTLIRPDARLQMTPTPDVVATSSGIAVSAGQAVAGEATAEALTDVVLGTKVPAETPLRDADRRYITICLTEIIGPIAPILVSRVERPNITREALVHNCAVHIRHGDERTRFLALVARPTRTGRSWSRLARFR